MPQVVLHMEQTKAAIREMDVNHPISLYAKKINELMAHSYSHFYGIPTIGLRFFTVYGPWGRPDMAPMIFSKAILEGLPIDALIMEKWREILLLLTMLWKFYTNVVKTSRNRLQF